MHSGQPFTISVHRMQGRIVLYYNWNSFLFQFTLNTAIMVFVYCLAIVMTLIFEMPYVNLAIKLLKPKPKCEAFEMQSGEKILNKAKSL